MKNTSLRIKNLSAALIGGFLLSSNASAENPAVRYTFTPDPAPVVFNDTCYFFSGHDEEGADYFEMNEWQCFWSTDMVNWTPRGIILNYKDLQWSSGEAWASQCIERNGKYYFYFTAVKSARTIGVAVADNPGGPYKDPLGKPLCGPNWDYIDPTVFIDKDGQAWLYFGNPKAYYVKLNEDMISYSGNIVQTDMSSGFGNGGSTYTEGPWFYRRGDLYYLLYAAAGIPEEIGYSTSTSPTGPWTYRGVIMAKNQTDLAFTNHCGVVDYKGHSYFFYHNQAINHNGFNRSTCVEEFTYNADGSIPSIKPTKEGPKAIGYVNPYKRVEGETMAYEEGLKIQENSVCSNKICLGFVTKNSFTKVANVNFGENIATSLKLNASCNSDGGKVEFHLDSKTGEIIATVDITPTGDWNTFKEFEAKVSEVSGIHDLYIVFKSDADYPCNMDYWQLYGEGSEEISTEIPEEKQEPFAGKPASIPGKIEAEDYDLGGEGKAYHDESAENEAGAYRKDRVDIEEVDAATYVLAYNIKGEWLEYTVDVKEATSYEWSARVSSTFEESGFRLYLDDEDITGAITVPQGEEWSNYTIIKGETKPLKEGEHILKLSVESSYFNIDYIEFKDKNTTFYEDIVNPQGIPTGDYKIFRSSGEHIGDAHLGRDGWSDLKETLDHGVYMLVSKSTNASYKFVK